MLATCKVPTRFETFIASGLKECGGFWQAKCFYSPSPTWLQIRIVYVVIRRASNLVLSYNSTLNQTFNLKSGESENGL